MKKYTLRYETKAWYEVEVMAENEQAAINKLEHGDVRRYTANKELEDEDLTPTDIQVVD